MSADELLESLQAVGIDVDPETADAIRQTDDFIDEDRREPDIEVEEPGALLLGLVKAGIPLPGDPTEVLQMLGVVPTPAVDPVGGDASCGEGDEEPAAPPATLSGEDLLENTDGELSRFREAGGEDEHFVASYLGADSMLHILRTAAQPEAVRPVFKTLQAPMARQLCREAGVSGLSAFLLAESVVEARIDEAHVKALAGVALGEMDVVKAERLERLADRHATRMRKSLEQLHRLRRPAVNVKIGNAGNVNLGQQVVNTDAGPALKAKLGTGGDDRDGGAQ